jgi:hypothetical protein
MQAAVSNNCQIACRYAKRLSIAASQMVPHNWEGSKISGPHFGTSLRALKVFPPLTRPAILQSCNVLLVSSRNALIDWVATGRAFLVSGTSIQYTQTPTLGIGANFDVRWKLPFPARSVCVKQGQVQVHHCLKTKEHEVHSLNATR